MQKGFWKDLRVLPFGLWLMLFVLIIAGLISRVAWIMFVFAKRSPLIVATEKVERIAFWMMILLSLGLLTSEYLTNALFNYYLFYVFIVGLLAYCGICRRQIIDEG